MYRSFLGSILGALLLVPNVFGQGLNPPVLGNSSGPTETAWIGDPGANPTERNWFTSSYWDNGVPDSTIEARINNGGFVKMQSSWGSSASTRVLRLGDGIMDPTSQNYVDNHSELVVRQITLDVGPGGEPSYAGRAYVGRDGARGTLKLTEGGTIETSRDLIVGSGSSIQGAIGNLTIEDGKLDIGHGLRLGMHTGSTANLNILGEGPANEVGGYRIGNGNVKVTLTADADGISEISANGIIEFAGIQEFDWVEENGQFSFQPVISFDNYTGSSELIVDLTDFEGTNNILLVRNLAVEDPTNPLKKYIINGFERVTIKNPSEGGYYELSYHGGSTRQNLALVRYNNPVDTYERWVETEFLESADRDFIESFYDQPINGTQESAIIAEFTRIDGDPDKDGVPNLVEYKLGRSPLHPEAPLRAVQVTSDTVELEHQIRTDRIARVTGQRLANDANWKAQHRINHWTNRNVQSTTVTEGFFNGYGAMTHTASTTNNGGVQQDADGNFMLNVQMDLPRDSNRRPNVLMFVVDDLNDYLGCLSTTKDGHPNAPNAVSGSSVSPHLDELARRGVLFTNAHCAGAWCFPSRASLFSGKYPYTTHAMFKKGYFHGPPDNDGKRHTLTAEEHSDLSRYTASSIYTIPEHFRATYGDNLVRGGGKLMHSSQDDRWGPNHATVRRDRFASPGENTVNDQGNVVQLKDYPLSQLQDPLTSTVLTRQQVGYFDWNTGSRKPFIKTENATDEIPMTEQDMDDYKVAQWVIDQINGIPNQQDPLPDDQAFFLGCGMFRPHLPLFCPDEFLTSIDAGISLPDTWDIDPSQVNCVLPPEAMPYISRHRLEAAWISYTGNSVAINDNSTATATTTVSSTDSIIDIDVRLSIIHPNVSDLRITLEGPDGTLVELVDGEGGSGDDFDGTVFDDSSSTQIGDGVAPFDRVYRPAESLECAFVDKTQNGVWKLHVTDSQTGSVGTIEDFDLRFNRTLPYNKQTYWLREQSNYDQWRDFVRAYMACIKFADHEIGQVMKALAARPEVYRNTIIVLVSDHGFHLSTKNKHHKGSLWRQVTRVPMIVVTPPEYDGTEFEEIGVPGSDCSYPVSLVDVFATLNDLAELPPVATDGRSLRPLLNSPYTGTLTPHRPFVETHASSAQSLQVTLPANPNGTASYGIAESYENSRRIKYVTAANTREGLEQAIPMLQSMNSAADYAEHYDLVTDPHEEDPDQD